MPIIEKKKLRHNQKIYEGVCPECKIIFYANKPSAKYCSNLCRVNAYQRRKKENPSKYGKKKQKIFINENKGDIQRYLREKGFKGFLFPGVMDYPYTQIIEIRENDRIKKLLLTKKGRTSFDLEEI